MLQTLLTIVVGTGCIIAMVSASRLESEKKLSRPPVVRIKNDRRYQRDEQMKIMNIGIYKRNVDLANTPVGRIDIRGIENAIMSDPWVADAEVYIDIDRVMHIEVTQRVPVARLFFRDGTSRYIDSTMHIMPLKENYVYYTSVVTNVPKLGSDSADLALRTRIVKLATTLRQDSFWSAQIAQIAVDSDNGFELVPVLGSHRILFGDTSGTQEKLYNLMAFYLNVLNKIGWDKYEVLDLRFNKQVVASPALPYAGPVDKAVEKMNWITSIEVTEHQKQHADSVRVHASAARHRRDVSLAPRSAAGKAVKPVAKQPAHAATKLAPAKVPAAKKPATKKPAAKAAAKSAAKSVTSAAKKAKAVNTKVPVKTSAGKNDGKQQSKKDKKAKYLYPETKGK